MICCSNSLLVSYLIYSSLSPYNSDLAAIITAHVLQEKAMDAERPSCFQT
jgi:hypothetical protein